MAYLTCGSIQTKDPNAIHSWLLQYGYIYEQWTQHDLPSEKLNDPLIKYEKFAKRLMDKRGYIHKDMVLLFPEKEGLDALLAKFSPEHHHTDDEVRFTVDGEGIFSLECGKGIWAELKVEKGDLLVIPAFHRHFFQLTEKRHIQCIRLFKDQKGWDPIYDESESFRPEELAWIPKP